MTMVKNPFDFITPKEILIPYAIADAIDTNEKLLTSRNILEVIAHTLNKSTWSISDVC